MPNWVRNKVKFRTDKVIKECIDERGEFDFNKILPMPKALEEDDGLDNMTQEERLLFLRDNDNCSDWYSWHVHFWGTKWNANETYVVDDYNVEFDTAWNMPEEIFIEISKKYNTTVEVEYADEGISENSGRTVYENGMLIEDEPGDEEFREKVWGWANGE